MLTAYHQPKFVSQIFTDIRGKQYRLTFLVALVNGELKGRLVSAEPISSSKSINLLTGNVINNIFCLPIIYPQKAIETEYISSFIPIISPYIELYFFTSQPTRAPSLK